MRPVDDSGGSKITGIWQIVKIKEFLQRWQQTTLGQSPKSSNPPKSDSASEGGLSPEINLRLQNSNTYCDSDEESCHSLDMPADIPRGCLAVYVGKERRRFIIPTRYLSDPLFKLLLDKVEEEFGCDHCGALTIPCDIETFKYLLQCMEHHRKEQDGGAKTAG